MSENVKKLPEENVTEEAKQTENSPAEPKAEGPAQRAPLTQQEAVERAARGVLKLDAPIMSAGQEIHELHYDFKTLTGIEYADAMDGDVSRRANSYQLTNRQALALFATAAAKNTEGVDRESVLNGLSINDTIIAVQAATLFFVVSSREGVSRITRA